MSTACEKLIYDVGLSNGDDTAYYLFRGYRVVAIDANPSMIEGARLRFAREIDTGRVTLLNVGVSNDSGAATFWISDNPGWSSFDRTIASRDGTGCRSLSIPLVQFSEIIREHGVPEYLKIDIEGNDRLCVEELKGRELPRYISVESECGSDSGIPESESLRTLELLEDVGYRSYKLVRQSTLTSVRDGVCASLLRNNQPARLFNKFINSAARGRLKVKGLATIAESLTDTAKIARSGFSFSFGSSGPWGDDIRGGWMPFETAKSIYLGERRAYFAESGRRLYSFWYDWHATY